MDRLAPRRFRPSGPVIWAGVLGGLAALSLAAVLPLSLLSGQLGNGIVALVIGVPCAGVGVVVALRQPGNPLGWLFLLIASCLFLATDGGDYASFSYHLGHHRPFGAVGLALDQMWAEGLALFVLVILLFPDGKLASPFWRWVGRQVVSWRRSSGERRQQLKWLASGAAVTMVSVVPRAGLEHAGRDHGATGMGG